MFTDVVATKIAQELFACHGIAIRLPGEYDYNFQINANNGQHFLLKISHPSEKKSILELQNEVLHKLQSAQLPFHSPVPQPTITGEWVGRLTFSEEHTNLVRLFSFIPGKLFANIRPHTPAILKSLGRQLGHLSQTLRSFKHPQARRNIKWDLQQASWIREHLHTIEDPENQKCVAHFLVTFESEVMPVLSSLRQSVIHGDINDYNVLVSNVGHETEQVSGFIDFGDVVETSTICELAIATTYAMLDNVEPLGAASIIIKEYHEVFPLEDKEIDILFHLIGIRLCISLVNSAIRKKENPDDAYLVISEKPAWNLLRTLRAIDAKFASIIFRKACGLTNDTHNK